MWIVAVVLVCGLLAGDGAARNLNIAVFSPQPNDYFLSAVQLGADEVNVELEKAGENLKMNVMHIDLPSADEDAVTKQSASLAAMSELLQRQRQPGVHVMVSPKFSTSVGAVYEETVLPLVQLASAMAIPTFGFTRDDMLNNGVKYPYFLRNWPSDMDEMHAMFSLCNHYGWTRLGLLFSGEDSDIDEIFQELGVLLNVDVVPVSFPQLPTDVEATDGDWARVDEDMVTALDYVESHDIRVVCVFGQRGGEDEFGHPVLGLNPRMPLTKLRMDDMLDNPEFVFIASATWASHFFNAHPNEASYTGWWGLSTWGSPSDAFLDAFVDRLHAAGVEDVGTRARQQQSLATLAYEIPYLLQQALGQLNDTWLQSDLLTALEHAHLTHLPWSDDSEDMRQFDVYGGDVSFVGGRRDVPFSIKNYDGKSFGKVGQWTRSLGLVVDDDVSWPGGLSRAPSSDPDPATLSTPTTAAVVTLTLATVLALGVVQVLMHRRRHLAVVQRANHFFLQLILFGSHMSCIAVLCTLLMPLNNVYRCSIPPLLLGVAFVFVFGSLLVKTLRLYKIFTEGGVRRREFDPLSTTSLNSKLGILVGYEVLLVAMWYLVDSPRVVLNVDPSYLHEVVYACSSSYEAVWLTLWLLPKLAVFGGTLVLVWKMRGLQSTVHEAKGMAVVIYINVLLLVLTVALYSGLDIDQLDVAVSVLCVATLAAVWSVLVVLFLPLLYSVCGRDSSKHNSAVSHGLSLSMTSVRAEGGELRGVGGRRESMDRFVVDEDLDLDADDLDMDGLDIAALESE